MADQILSQEEIDALLTAMDSGDIDVEDDQQGAEVEIKPYDLTSQSIMQRGQFDALEEVYDKFVNQFQSSLSSLLQRPIDVKIISKETVKFGEFVKAFSNPTGFVIFNMEPLIGSSLLAIEPNLIFSLIDCMFGGDGTPLEKIREFTLIEQRMFKRFSKDIIRDLEKAWDRVYNVRMRVKKIETKPEFVNLVNPSDRLIVVVFSVSSDEFSGNLHLCMPFLMLEPIKEQLSSSYLREKDRASSFGKTIKKLLKNTDVTIVAELGRSRRSVSQVLNLEVDDVIKLSTGPQNSILLSIEDVPKFRGMPGVIKGSRAVQVTEMIDNNGGD